MKTSIIEFKLFDSKYCFNTEHVKYVYELEEHQAIHGLHESVIGITKYNNDMMLLIDTAKLYSDKYLDMKKQKSVIVVPDKNGLLYGMVVDEIIKLEEVDVVKTSVDLSTEDMVINHYKEDEDNLVNEIYPLPLLEKYNIPAMASIKLKSDKKIFSKDDKSKNYLLFRSGEKSYAIESSYVKEVVENEFDFFELEQDDKSFIKGAIALRDEIVKLIDFHSKIASDVLVLEVNGNKLAIEVDEVYDIEDFSLEKINYLEEKDNHIEAFYNRGGNVIAIVNPLYYFKNESKKEQQEESNNSKVNTDEHEFLIFYIEKQKYAIDMSYVRQVMESDSITKTNSSAIGAKEHVAYIATWNHRAVQVLKLDNFLKSSVNKEHNEIIFLEIGDYFVAFLVDEIDSIVHLNKSAISKMREEANDDIISGAILYKDEVIVQINSNFLVDK